MVAIFSSASASCGASARQIAAFEAMPGSGNAITTSIAPNRAAAAPASPAHTAWTGASGIRAGQSAPPSFQISAASV